MKECKCILKSYSSYIKHSAESSYFPYITAFALFLFSIPLLSPITTKARSETEGLWTAILLTMAFGCTAEYTQNCLCLWRDILASASLQKHVLCLWENPTSLNWLKLLYFCLMFHGMMCMSVHCVTHHNESETLEEYLIATELSYKHIPAVQ